MPLTNEAFAAKPAEEHRELLADFYRAQVLCERSGNHEGAAQNARVVKGILSFGKINDSEALHIGERVKNRVAEVDEVLKLLCGA